MADDLDDLSLPSASDLAVETIEQVQTTSDKLPSPTFVSNAVSPEVGVIEGRKWCRGVTHETASRVGVHAEKERDEKVVSVPESLERLLSNPVMGRGVDEKHA